MQQYLLRLCLLAALFFCPATAPAHGKGAPAGVRILKTVDYRGALATILDGVSNHGDCAGYFIDETGASRGFILSRMGQIHGPVVDPNDTADLTLPQGMNDSRRLCGYYQADSNYHGFLLTGHSYITYDVPGAVNTFILGENDAGYLVGSFDDSSGVHNAFFEAGSFVTRIVIGASTTAEARSVNASNEIVGSYYDSVTASYHGFFRDSAGNLTFPLDAPGSTATLPFGINDNGIVVGRYQDAAGKQHGHILQLPDVFTPYDFPCATFTSLNGVNNSNVISGSYIDMNGATHGFLARLR